MKQRERVFAGHPAFSLALHLPINIVLDLLFEVLHRAHLVLEWSQVDLVLLLTWQVALEVETVALSNRSSLRIAE